MDSGNFIHVRDVNIAMIHGFTELKKDTMALKFIQKGLSEKVDFCTLHYRLTIKMEVQLLFKCKLGLFMIKKVKKGQNSVKFPCPA